MHILLSAYAYSLILIDHTKSKPLIIIIIHGCFGSIIKIVNKDIKCHIDILRKKHSHTLHSYCFSIKCFLLVYFQLLWLSTIVNLTRYIILRGWKIHNVLCGYGSHYVFSDFCVWYPNRNNRKGNQNQ